MTDKSKIIHCLIFFVVGLLLHVGDMCQRYLAYDGFFYGLQNICLASCISIPVIIINVTICITCYIFLQQGIQYRKTCGVIFFCSFYFMMYVMIMYWHIWFSF